MKKRRSDGRGADYDRETLWNIIKTVKVPVLTLDERFNTLFADMVRKPEIKKIIRKLNDLIKEQGGIVNKVKDMKVLKKRLMTNIVDNMSDVEDKKENELRGRKQDANKRLITDINSKLDSSTDRLMELPYEILNANRELLLETLIHGYGIISHNTEQSGKLADEIDSLQTELDEKIKNKEFIDRQTNALYSFMHDMVGAEMLERFDREFGQR